MPRKLQSRDPRSEKPAIRKGQTELRESRVIGKNDPKLPKIPFWGIKAPSRIVGRQDCFRVADHSGSIASWLKSGVGGLLRHHADKLSLI